MIHMQLTWMNHAPCANASTVQKDGNCTNDFHDQSRLVNGKTPDIATFETVLS